MNTNLQIKSFKEYHSLEVQESRQIFRGNGGNTSSALMVNGNMPLSKGEMSTRNATPRESSQPLSRPSKSKDIAPRLQVTVEFAAKQLFQILLVDIKRRNAQLNGETGIVPGAICV